MFISIIITLIEKCLRNCEVLFLSFRVNIYKIHAYTNYGRGKVRVPAVDTLGGITKTTTVELEHYNLM